jgi:tetratricopeptide (TPR) repeat protein
MGVVYVVRDGETGRTQAVKTFISDAFEAYEGAAERFRQEASVWIGLGKHPNIVLAEIVHEVDHRPHLFLEYVAGGDLGTWIKAGRLIEASMVTKLALNFCDGMNHAANWGMHVHRDIKPSNCLMTVDGILKVTDFGLARAVAGNDLALEINGDERAYHQSPSLTRTGAAAGTAAYMAPEQFDDAKNVTVSADVYSFGVMLFEMVTGETPFVADDWHGYSVAHKRAPVPNLPVTTPKRLVRIIDRCLEKDPEARFGSFLELRTELDRLHEQLTGQGLDAPLPRSGETAADLAVKCGNLAVIGKLDAALEAGLLAVQYDPALPIAWGNLGYVHNAGGRFPESLEAYERALALDPLVSTFWQGKAISLSNLGRDADALAAQDRALQLNPRQINTWHNRGRTLGQLGRAEEAIASFDEALALDPNFADAWLNRGYRLEKMDRLDDALNSYRRATEVNPHLRLAWKNRRLLARRLQKPDEERLAATHLVDIPSHSAPDYDERGVALGVLGRDNEALESFDRAIELDASYSDALVNKGWRLDQMGRRGDSVACYRRAVTVDPLNEMGWSNLAYSLLASGDDAEAAECFGRLTQLRPQSKSALADLALALGNAGRRDEAVAIALRLTKLDPDYPPGWYTLAHQLSLQTRYDEAIPCYQRAIELTPTNDIAWSNLGFCFASRGRSEEALEAYGHAAELGNKRAYCLASDLLSNLGRYEESQEAAARAVEFEPGNYHCHLALGVSLIGLERFSLALPSLETARDLGSSRAVALIAQCLRKLGWS